MPSNQEFYDAISNISIDADTLNLNTDQVESKLDTTTGLLTTLSADTAIIKADMADGVTVGGTVIASQSTASSLKGQAQILNSAGTLITYSESGTYGNPSVDVISVQDPQGTSATATTFSLTTPSSVLVSASTSRKVLTVFNAGAGILYISPTSTATTTSFQVRLASGDYWECPDRQVTMAHRAVYETAGTAYITSIS
jgi:hypothetical protein